MKKENGKIRCDAAVEEGLKVSHADKEVMWVLCLSPFGFQFKAYLFS